ncbi:hypothetical protein V8C44DRAFT_315826 [Trichoderma aethiopicum]
MYHLSYSLFSVFSHAPPSSSLLVPPLPPPAFSSRCSSKLSREALVRSSKEDSGHPHASSVTSLWLPSFLREAAADREALGYAGPKHLRPRVLGRGCSTTYYIIYYVHACSCSCSHLIYKSATGRLSKENLAFGG